MGHPFSERRAHGKATDHSVGGTADRRANRPVEEPKGIAGPAFRLAAGSEPISRQYLGLLFLPTDRSKPQDATSQELCNRLQRVLPISKALLIGEETVGLHRSLVWSDAILFRQLAEDDNRTPRLAILCRARRSLKGPFLDGYSIHGRYSTTSGSRLARRLWERDFRPPETFRCSSQRPGDLSEVSARPGAISSLPHGPNHAPSSDRTLRSRR